MKNENLFSALQEEYAIKNFQARGLTPASKSNLVVYTHWVKHTMGTLTKYVAPEILDEVEEKLGEIPEGAETLGDLVNALENATVLA